MSTSTTRSKDLSGLSKLLDQPGVLEPEETTTRASRSSTRASRASKTQPPVEKKKKKKPLPPSCLKLGVQVGWIEDFEDLPDPKTKGVCYFTIHYTQSSGKKEKGRFLFDTSGTSGYIGKYTKDGLKGGRDSFTLGKVLRVGNSYFIFEPLGPGRHRPNQDLCTVSQYIQGGHHRPAELCALDYFSWYVLANHLAQRTQGLSKLGSR